MNAAQMTDAELMAFEPADELQARAVAAELRRRAEAQFREADQLERWLDRQREATEPEAG